MSWGTRHPRDGINDRKCPYRPGFRASFPCREEPREALLQLETEFQPGDGRHGRVPRLRRNESCIAHGGKRRVVQLGVAAGTDNPRNRDASVRPHLDFKFHFSLFAPCTRTPGIVRLDHAPRTRRRFDGCLPRCRGRRWGGGRRRWGAALFWRGRRGRGRFRFRRRKRVGGCGRRNIRRRGLGRRLGHRLGRLHIGGRGRKRRRLLHLLGEGKLQSRQIQLGQPVRGGVGHEECGDCPAQQGVNANGKRQSGRKSHGSRPAT